VKALAILLALVALCDRPRVSQPIRRSRMNGETSISVESSQAGASAIVKGSGTAAVTINAGSHRTVVKVEATTITATCSDPGLEVKAEVTAETITIDFGSGPEARQGEVKDVGKEEAGKGLTGRFRLKRD
jgi:hypothetical protein